MQSKKGKEKETSSFVATYSFRSSASVAYNFLAACLSLAMHGNSSAESVLVTLSLDLRVLLLCWIESALYNLADNDIEMLPCHDGLRVPSVVTHLCALWGFRRVLPFTASYGEIVLQDPAMMLLYKLQPDGFRDLLTNVPYLF